MGCRTATFSAAAALRIYITFIHFAVVSKKGKIAGFCRVVLRVFLGVFLLVLGLVVGLYSPWVQDSLCDAALKYVNARGADMEIGLDRLRLRFPLKVQVSGLSVSDRTTGDTLIRAEAMYASVKLLPLLKGDVDVSRATLINARYVMGAPDSALYLRAEIGKLDLNPARVSLGSPMTIDLEDATLAHSRVSIAIRPDSTAADTAAKESSPMVFKAGRLHFVDFSYVMSLDPGIDSIGMTFGDAVLADGTVDLGGQSVDVRSLTGKGLMAAYIAAPAGQTDRPEAAEEADSTSSAPSKPWTVKVKDIDFDGGNALYTSRGYEPQPGMDFGYISVDSLRLHVTDFFNRASELTLPIALLEARERCGLDLTANGTLAIDSVGLHIDSFTLATPRGTRLNADGLMGMGDMARDGSLPLRLEAEGEAAPADLASMFPAMAVIASGLPENSKIELKADVRGTTSRLDIEALAMDVNRCFDLKADGSVDWPMNPQKLGGEIAFDGNIYNITSLKNKMLDRALSKMFNIPPMTLKGRVAMKGDNISGHAAIATGKGSLAADGSWTSTNEGYNADISLNDFPVDAILPAYGVGRVTARLQADGHGLNPLSHTMAAKAGFDITSAEYGGYTYCDLSGTVDLADGHATADIRSTDPAARFELTASGNLSPEPLVWTGTLDLTRLDLQAMKMSASPMSFAAKMDFSASVAPADSIYNADITMPSFAMTDSAGTVSTDSIAVTLESDASSTRLRITNENLLATLFADAPLLSMADGFTAASDTLTSMLARHSFDIVSLQKALPEFRFRFSAGRRNLLARYLAKSDMSFNDLDMTVANDSLITMRAGVRRFVTGSTTLDTITFSARQDSTRLLFKAEMNNRPGTFDDFAHVRLRGYVSEQNAKMMIDQRNIKGNTGFNIGASASYADSTLRVVLVPTDPIIGYKQWTVNGDNYVTYDFPHRHIDANLHLLNAGSSVELYTIHDEHHGEEGHVHDEFAQEDIVLKVKNLRLSDWLSLNPFAPPVKGIASADMRVRWDSGSLNGSGTIGVDSLYYGKERVGDFLADVDLSTNAAGTVKAKAGLTVNGVRTIDIEGSLNDSTAVSPFNLDFSMIHFPLATMNPFMPAGTVKLRGMLNGKMDITGDLSAPRFNGAIDFDSTAVRVNMLGTDFTFSETPIDVVDNLVSFKNFSITGTNKNPLKVNGTADITNLSNVALDLSLSARDMGLVNSSRPPKYADVYGKAFIDLDATVKGNMSFLSVDAGLTLLGGTNVFYNIPDAANTIQSMKNDQMVRFVQFNDTASFNAEEKLPESSMAMSIDAVLTIEAGSTITVNLSSNGTDKLQIQPEGTLNYTQPPLSDGRLTGRLNLNKGMVRYSLPVLGEKSFDFQEGSYVSFTGPMLNPSLGIKAVDKVRANVTQEGQNSRLINFDVILSATGTLNTMNVAFDLSTTDDLTIANELQSMTAEQRANQAMNLLLYGTYTGPGVKANANLSGNALYGFLEGKLNSWAAQNIRGVDLSFGINQYDKTFDGTTSTATQYSYKVSKSLFNDRFKIVVGGNYSTDANNDENLSQNLINDISFEYLLNRQGTMLVRLFRHTGYESILEGEVTQTGVGFVYRRKIHTLLDMFRPFRKNTIPEPEPVPESTTE